MNEEDKQRAIQIIKNAGISYAGIIVEWTDTEGKIKYGVVPSNLERSVTDLYLLTRYKIKKGC